MTEATTQTGDTSKNVPVQRQRNELYRRESPAAVDVNKVKKGVADLAGVNVDQLGFVDSRQSVHPARLVFIVMVAFRKMITQDRFTEETPDAEDMLGERMVLEWPWGRRLGHRTTRAPVRDEIERTLGSIYGLALRAATGDAVRRIEIPLRNHEKNPVAALIVDLLARMQEFTTKDGSHARKFPFEIAWTGVDDEELKELASGEEEAA